MNLNIKIKNINVSDLKDYNLICNDCSFWFDSKDKDASILDNFRKTPNFFCFFKSIFFDFKSKYKSSNKLRCFLKNGGFCKIAFSRKNEVKGVVLYGNYFLFPNLKNFAVYPPEFESMFLGCIYIDEEYEEFGIAEKLLLSIEKDLIKANIKSIETIAKRENEDLTDSEYQNIHFLPIKFLISKGFYVRKNDEYFPLLRLELKNIETVILEEESLILDLFAIKELGSSSLVKTGEEKI